MNCAISMEMIPRITSAQKMDVLTSQANLAGYVAVITAAERLDKIFPMMMTPAGTIAPAHVFVIGAGVDNPLFVKENTRMLFGDAKATVQQLVAEFKES